ncbi:MAG: hypothetical protein HQM16_03965 [Deltaproteobacteria bacterium]|nr:hypothetical protein [Deltaproteobacteria bacterium]
MNKNLLKFIPLLALLSCLLIVPLQVNAGGINFSASYTPNWNGPPPWQVDYVSPVLWWKYSSNNTSYNYNSYNLTSYRYGSFWGSVGLWPGHNNYFFPIVRSHFKYPVPNYLNKKKWNTRLAALTEKKMVAYFKAKQDPSLRTNQQGQKNNTIPSININEPSELKIPKESKISHDGTVVMNFY